MPWKITQQGGRHCVVKSDSGVVVKCHDDEDSAKSHLAALYANYTKSNGRTRPSILDPISPGYSSDTAKSMNNCAKPKVEYSKKAKEKIAQAQGRRKSLTNFERKSLAEDISVLSEDKDFLKGGPGSGNFGHRGRPGAVGGSGGGTGPIAPGAKIKIGESAGNFLAGEVGHVISSDGNKVKVKLANDESVIDLLRADIAGVTYREVGDHMVNEDDGSLEKTQADFDAADRAAEKLRIDNMMVGQDALASQWATTLAEAKKKSPSWQEKQGGKPDMAAEDTYLAQRAKQRGDTHAIGWREKQGGRPNMAAEDAYLARRERARGR